MCTVTYIPINNNHFVLTSNRDEQVSRETIPPVKEQIGSHFVFFPKDVQGGTWIATGNNGRVCCLLNGAFEKHERKTNYRKSRGLILLESFKEKSIFDYLQFINLTDIEPFTLIVIEPIPFNDSVFSNKLIEFRWDGNNKHLSTLENEKKYIWSSSTLYDSDAREMRETWFKSYFAKKDLFTPNNILQFHSTTHGKNPEIDIIMNRNNVLKTISITQIELKSGSFKMHYHDLIKQDKLTVFKKINKSQYV